MSDLTTDLRTLIVRATRRKIDPDLIVGENLIDELGLTSIDGLEILIWVESEYQIEIADEDLSVKLVTSIDALQKYIQAQLDTLERSKEAATA